MSPHREHLPAVEVARETLVTALAARAAAVPPLVDAVREHAPHERAPCEHVTAMLERAVAQQAAPVDERFAAEDELQLAVAGLERVGDAYSEVRAAPEYRTAQDAVFFARKGVRDAADAYNAAVASHNERLDSGRRFPWSKAAGDPIAFFGTPEL